MSDLNPETKAPAIRPTSLADQTTARTRHRSWFSTEITVVDEWGNHLKWESRLHRKHLRRSSRKGGTRWAPLARGWWIAVCFAVGSILFALGTVPAYAHAVGGRADAATFFVGSLFFTTAGFLTYREAVDAGSVSGQRRRKVFVVEPHRIDWWAAGIQLIGTLFFNESTGHALATDLTAEATKQLVWRPDALGSVCFLVASGLAWYEVCHGAFSFEPASWSWWIAGLNLLGSVAFGVSAVAAFVVPATGDTLSMQLSNLGTFVGALCFLVGAIFLLPERTDERGVGAVQAAAATGLVSGLVA
jgi:hypothetical protein